MSNKKEDHRPPVHGYFTPEHGYYVEGSWYSITLREDGQIGETDVWDYYDTFREGLLYLDIDEENKDKGLWQHCLMYDEDNPGNEDDEETHFIWLFMFSTPYIEVREEVAEKLQQYFKYPWQYRLQLRKGSTFSVPHILDDD